MFKFQSECIWEKCNITLIYRSPSQSSEEFNTFLSNFEFLLDYMANRYPFVSIIIGDFNARSDNWCSSDETTYEGKKLESLTSKCGFKQVRKQFLMYRFNLYVATKFSSELRCSFFSSP